MNLNLLKYLKNHKTGWIDYDGTFIPCNYMEHDSCAWDHFGVCGVAAESSGRVKIYYDPLSNEYGKHHTCRKAPKYSYYIENHLTLAQYNTLYDMDFIIDEDELP